MTPRMRIRSVAPVLALAAGVAACAADDGGEAVGDMREAMEKRVAETRERLALTDGQIEKIAPILRRGFEAQAALLEKQGFARDGARSREGDRPNLREMRKLGREMDKIREQTLKELGEVLDAKQLDEYEDIQEERKAELRRRMRGRR